MSALGTLPYTDALGRTWLIEKLDRLLGEPIVQTRVRETLRASLNAKGKFNTGRAFALARRRYKREECGALLHILVVRLWDREDLDDRA